jgi:hypothetical protein
MVGENFSQQVAGGRLHVVAGEIERADGAARGNVPELSTLPTVP